jgi:hypothetical protein
MIIFSPEDPPKINPSWRKNMIITHFSKSKAGTSYKKDIQN